MCERILCTCVKGARCGCEGVMCDCVYECCVYNKSEKSIYKCGAVYMCVCICEWVWVSVVLVQGLYF